jgi:hypothetical protein
VAYLGLVELETILAAKVSVAMLAGTVLTTIDAMNCEVLPVIEVHVVELAVFMVRGTLLVADQFLLGMEGLVALDARELLFSVIVVVVAGDGPATLLRLGDGRELFLGVGVAVVVVIVARMAGLAGGEVDEVKAEGKHTPSFQQLQRVSERVCRL